MNHAHTRILADATYRGAQTRQLFLNAFVTTIQMVNTL
ncbi:MAG: hypothetical protein RL651_2037, partial [Pseudomonadota bacterium]